MRQTVRAAATLAIVALLAAACGSSGSSNSSSSSSPSSSSSGGSSAAKFTGCMVTDTGGIDDKSFNASSWQGMQEAQSADPSKVSVKYLQSTSSADYASNISAFLGQKCGIIVTVGFLMAGATGGGAPTRRPSSPSWTAPSLGLPDQLGKPSTPPTNVDSLVFNTVQDGFLGGYLAAGMTKTGKVATFGGQKLPTVTIYMDGFWDGVQYYNQQHHTHVKVLGWNEQTQSGEFTTVSPT